MRGLYETVRGYITAAAEQMPEADYAFKPTPEVRSFGQLVGHVANAGYAFCDKAHQMDPMKGGKAVNFFGQLHARLSVLAFNMGHDFEHYGNIATYLRLKGMVPPSSQRGM